MSESDTFEKFSSIFSGLRPLKQSGADRKQGEPVFRLTVKDGEPFLSFTGKDDSESQLTPRERKLCDEL